MGKNKSGATAVEIIHFAYKAKKCTLFLKPIKVCFV
jgi:hypothetical protein